MAVTINTAVDSNYFTLNGTRYARIYQPLLGQVSTEVGIYNAFDTTLQLLNSTPFAEFTVDTLTYASADLLIIALLPVIYKYQGTGAVTGAPDWGDIGGTLSNQTDLQTEFDGKSDTGHAHSFASLTSKPTTILGFGLATDAYNKTEVDSLLSGKADSGDFVDKISTEDIGGVKTFTDAFNITHASSNWTVAGTIENNYNVTTAAADEKTYDTIYTTSANSFRLVNDANDAATTWLKVERTGINSDLITMSADAQVFNGNAWTFNGGTAGDAILTIEADTDNNDESDHPSLRLKQDGALIDWRIGIGEEDTDVGGNSNNLVFTLLAGSADGIYFSPDAGASTYEIMHQNNGGSGSGFDADTLRSFAPTTGTTLNTIALRDANGDLFAADFRADNNVYTGLGATAGNSLRIYGTGVGTANIAYLTWHDSAGTRQGYAGFPSAGHSDLTIYNDASATYIKLESTGGNTGFTYFDTAVRQVYHSGLYPLVTAGAHWSGTKQTLPYIGTAGVMEIGKYIDFHLTAGSVADSDGRLNLQSANVLDFNGQFECDEIRLEGTADASLSSTTHAFQSGSTTGNNIIMDNNEIMQRSNGAAGTMEFNREGGTVNFYGATAGSIIVAQANSILNLNDNVDLRFGNSGGEGMIYSNGTSIYWDMKADKDIFFRDVTTTRFTFDISNGWLTAANFKLSSDKRLKKNIKPLSKNKGLFNWVSFNPKTELTQKRYGVVADEVIKTNPELVSVDADGFYAVSYTDLFVLDAEHKDKLIAAQTKEIDSLKFRMEQIEARLELLTKELL